MREQRLDRPAQHRHARRAAGTASASPPPSALARVRPPRSSRRPHRPFLPPPAGIYGGTARCHKSPALRRRYVADASPATVAPGTALDNELCSRIEHMLSIWAHLAGSARFSRTDGRHHRRPFRALAPRLGPAWWCPRWWRAPRSCGRSPRRGRRAELGLDAARTAVQLAGREPRSMAEAARLLRGAGGADHRHQLRLPGGEGDQRLVRLGADARARPALRLIEAVVGAVDVPVTLKMRLGWDDGCRTRRRSPRAPRRPASAMITVHGRTRCQFYDGARRLGGDRARQGGGVGPGDRQRRHRRRRSARAARARSRRGRGDGRARGARPALAARPRIAAELAGRRPPAAPTARRSPDLDPRPLRGDSSSFYGRELGVRVARKHLGWYWTGFGGGRPARTAST